MNASPLSAVPSTSLQEFAKPGPSRSVNPSPISTIAEHRQLFASYAYGANSNKRSYSGEGKGVGKRVLKKVAICTLKFVCSAKIDASKAPSTNRERAVLNNADLGEKSIQLDANANQVQCHQRILKHFLKLVETGYGMLFYQRGVDGGFFAIGPPYTPKRLKDAAGSAKIYLRPLQKNLEVDPTAAEGEVSIP